MSQDHDKAEDHHKVPKAGKKKIPNPSEVPPHKHDEVMGLVAEQFINRHYGVKQGSVSISPIDDAHAQVSFIRTTDPSVPAEDHGIDLA